MGGLCKVMNLVGFYSYFVRESGKNLSHPACYMPLWACLWVGKHFVWFAGLEMNCLFSTTIPSLVSNSSSMNRKLSTVCSFWESYGNFSWKISGDSSPSCSKRSMSSRIWLNSLCFNPVSWRERHTSHCRQSWLLYSPKYCKSMRFRQYPVEQV